MSDSTVSALNTAVTRRLIAAMGNDGEGRSAARIIMEDVGGFSREYIFANGDRAVLPFVAERVLKAVERVENGEPVQYVTGTAPFAGLMLRVTPDVLVPRPETEGLVDIIADRYGSRSDLSVLDICTGSGCIAVSLALRLPFSTVGALDISAPALKVARENAEKYKVRINFRQEDALKLTADREEYDIIVSNPPYVTVSEKAGIDKRVLEHEPALALFVPDSDPLRFYRAISAYAIDALRHGGGLYFEINRAYPEEIRKLLEDDGFENVEILRDYCGNYRYAIAFRP